MKKLINKKTIGTLGPNPFSKPKLKANVSGCYSKFVDNLRIVLLNYIVLSYSQFHSKKFP